MTIFRQDLCNNLKPHRHKNLWLSLLYPHDYHILSNNVLTNVPFYCYLLSKKST